MTDIVAVRRPQVAQTTRKSSPALIIAGLLVLGLSIVLWLSAARAAQNDAASSLPALTTTIATDPAQTPSSEAPSTAQQDPAPGSFFVPRSSPVTLNATPPTAAPARSGYAPSVVIPLTNPAPPVDPMRERMRAPALIVDLAQADTRSPVGVVQVRSDSGQIEDEPAVSVSSSTTSTSQSPATQGTIGTPVGGGAAPSGLSDTERFATRIGNEEVEVAEARQLDRLDRLVPQGAVIGAVMETALNSDLPGFARAIISREVRSFDGSAILIPPGSRVIGQYKSGIAQGASRVFVVWTRLIRPDGVSIELASPATDDLGRAGIGGKVNSHFIQRFGGAILTSVLSGAINAATASLSRGSIYVSSASEASSLASQAGRSSDIPPTITTRQGATVRIFVARDLDFSRVGPAR